MAGLCLIPLLAGAAPLFLISRLCRRSPDDLSLGLWRAGVVTLTVGSCLEGVLAIYGTTSVYIPVYAAAGALALIAGALRFGLNRKARNF